MSCLFVCLFSAFLKVPYGHEFSAGIQVEVEERPTALVFQGEHHGRLQEERVNAQFLTQKSQALEFWWATKFSVYRSIYDGINTPEEAM